MSHKIYDLIVAGSGAAGLAAAILAHARGMSVVILEKTALIGGTSCYSGGVAWVPNSQHNVDSGIADSIDRAELYLDTIVDAPHEREARRHYLRRGAEAIANLEQETGPLFYVRAINSPDYYPDAKGASLEGRAMTPLTVDGRILGRNFRDLRAPLPEFCLFGRQMLELIDVYHLLNARKSIRSAYHSAKLMLRDVRDRLFHAGYGRGTRLTGGNALVASLYRAALDRKIPILRDTALHDLIMDGKAVKGVVAERNGVRETIHATRGVILATGGFPWSREHREKRMEEAPIGYSATSPASTGDGIAIATAKGAKFDPDNVEGAFWSPVSVGKRPDGSVVRFPHLMADRAKPGLIAVNKHGKRFYNEAENYHDFVRAMLGRFHNEDQQPVHLLCDAAYMRKYAFGAVPPLASERRRAIRSGYLIKASSVAELATRTGLDPVALTETIRGFNADAAKGIDTQFGKGSSAYNRYLGDATHTPNPCLGPIATAPFYAIRVHAGDIGTASGLAADLNSRVLDENGEAISGLYACGNDRNSIMGGFYPSGGITIGPALVFAYLAVEHAARSAEA